MKTYSLVGLFALLSLSSLGAELKEIIGTWRLVSATSRIVATGEVTKIWGDNPLGYISYSHDGRMIGIVTFGIRPKPTDLSKVTDAERIQLYRTLLSYGGTYTFDGTKVINYVDISSNETWNGTSQIRYVRFEGDTMILTTPEQPRSADGQLSVGEIRFEKVKKRDQ